MNNQIRVFDNSKFGEVKTIIKDDEVWFIGREIATILGYGNGNVKSKALSNAISDHIEEEDKIKLNYDECKKLFRVYQNDDPTFKINSNGMTIINESGLYSLILSSKLPQAKEFKRWVTREVLPSIRKHGAYMTPQKIEEVLLNPDTIIQLATALKQEQEKNKNLIKENKELIISNEEQEKQIIEMKPKVTYYDIILQSTKLMTITQIAKDYGYSGAKMNKLLNDLKIQYKQGNTWLLYAKYQDKGYTSSKTHQYGYDENENPKIQIYTCWTQKGRVFLYNFLKENGILPLIEKEDDEF